MLAEADETHSIESDVADQDMTARDLVWVLENLRFRHPNALSTLRIDRGVRDFLVRAIAPPGDRRIVERPDGRR
jgi:hypothetical protein